MRNAPPLPVHNSTDKADLYWQITSALHVAFNFPEGTGLRHALGAPDAPNNKHALHTWVETQLISADAKVWTPVMNELVTRLHDELQRQEQLLWV